MTFFPSTFSNKADVTQLFEVPRMGKWRIVLWIALYIGLLVVIGVVKTGLNDKAAIGLGQTH